MRKKKKTPIQVPMAGGDIGAEIISHMEGNPAYGRDFLWWLSYPFNIRFYDIKDDDMDPVREAFNIETAVRVACAFVDVTGKNIQEDERYGMKGIASDILVHPECARGHYKTFDMRKKSGGFRKIEAPETLLKRFQRLSLDNWWYRQQGPPRMFQGFVPNRGILTNAFAHVEDDVFGKDKTLIKVDLRDFFMSCTRVGVMNAILFVMGNTIEDNKEERLHTFPRALTRIAHALKEIKMFGFISDRLTTMNVIDLRKDPVLSLYVVAAEVIVNFTLLSICCLDERLPQGSPCSPALSVVFIRKLMLSIRRGLHSILGDDFTQTVFADDMCVTLPRTPGTSMVLDRVLRMIIGKIFRNRDLSVNADKVGVFNHGTSQRVTGVCITDKLSISRKERDQVRAELHLAATGVKALDDNDKMRLRGVRAWMRGVDKQGWDARCEVDFQKAVGV